MTDPPRPIPDEAVKGALDRAWTIRVCAFCGEHVNDCACDWSEQEPPTIDVAVVPRSWLP